MTLEEAHQVMNESLREETKELVSLRVEREALTARIAALESSINLTIGVDALAEKLYGDLLKVRMAKYCVDSETGSR